MDSGNSTRDRLLDRLARGLALVSEKCFMLAQIRSWRIKFATAYIACRPESSIMAAVG